MTLLVFVITFFFVTRSSKIFIRTIHSLNFLLSKNSNLIWYLFALILLPGTILHELSHLVTATLLLVRTGNLDFIPQFKPGQGIALGSAQIAKTDIFRMSLIGLAPTIIGLSSLLLITTYSNINFSLNYLVSFYNHPNFFSSQAILSYYFIFVITNTLHTSSSDRQSWPLLIVFILLLFSFNYFFPIFDSSQLLTFLPKKLFSNLSTVMIIALVVNSTFTIFIYTFLRIVLWSRRRFHL